MRDSAILFVVPGFLADKARSQAGCWPRFADGLDFTGNRCLRRPLAVALFSSGSKTRAGLKARSLAGDTCLAGSFCRGIAALCSLSPAPELSSRADRSSDSCWLGLCFFLRASWGSGQAAAPKGQFTSLPGSEWHGLGTAQGINFELRSRLWTAVAPSRPLLFSLVGCCHSFALGCSSLNDQQAASIFAVTFPGTLQIWSTVAVRSPIEFGLQLRSAACGGQPSWQLTSSRCGELKSHSAGRL